MEDRNRQFAVVILTLLSGLMVPHSNAIGQLAPASLGAETGRLTSPQTGTTPQVYRVDESVQVGDITFVQGDRVNFVNGSGLVFGLAGTGGKAEQTRAMARNYFTREGIGTQQADTANISSVVVSGKIPPYARKGETILVSVSVADDATSLRGGHLYQTPLRGVDGEIYAIAQGPIVTGGTAFGDDSASIQKNHPTAGQVEAIVEREICMDQMPSTGRIRLVLYNKSYANVSAITNKLNETFPNSSRALDQGTVEIAVPHTFRATLPQFISMIGRLRVTPSVPARIVINQKTGTIVMGQNVRISKVSFANENIVVSSTQNPVVSQPAPLSGGQTVVLPRSNVNVIETAGTYNVWNGSVSVGELARTLNELGVSPSTLISVLTSLKNKGALQAELILN